MKKLKYISLVLLAFCSLKDLSAQGKSYTLKNDRYEISIGVKSIHISVLNEPNSVRTLTPTIQVMQALQDPRVFLKRSDNNLSPQVAWKNPQDQKKSPADTTGELDFYKSAKMFTLQAASVSKVNATTVRFAFKKNAAFMVQMDVSLPAGNETPIIETNLKVDKKAWYSVGFVSYLATNAAASSPNILFIDTPEVSEILFILLYVWRSIRSVTGALLRRIGT